MAKKKNIIKAKEPVRLRFKELTNGNRSLYLDIYKNGKRTYEFLRLYLIPETDYLAKTQNTNTLQAANAIKAQRIIELANDEAGISKSSLRSKILLADWMAVYGGHKKETGQSPSYHDNIEKSARHLLNYKGGNVMLKDVDKNFCRGFINYLNNAKRKDGKPLAKVTAANYFRCFTSALNYAVKQDMLPINPVSKLDADEKIKIPESTREYLTVEELKKMIDAKCVNEATKHAFIFSCFCGLRSGDVRNLTWGDIKKDGAHYKIKIVMGKTRKTLYLPLSEEALKWLPERNGKTDSEKVFNLPFHTYVNVVLKGWAQSCGITKNVSFHTARHTFATMGLTAGTDIYTMSKLLGHTKIETTQIYAKIIDEKKDEAVKRISDLFKE